MTTIRGTELISAPITVCFTTSLDLDIEVEAAKGSRVEAVAGVRSGIIRAGESVTWRARQFGMWITHTSLISGYDEPIYFQDRMTKGLFKSFKHDHFFRTVGTATEMRDEMEFSMPWYLLGVLSERIIVRPRMRELLRKRNNLIKERAESLG